MPRRTPNPAEIGALWRQVGLRGEYWTGTINGQRVVIFRNEDKRPGTRAPDWRVLRARKVC